MTTFDSFLKIPSESNTTNTLAVTNSAEKQPEAEPVVQTQAKVPAAPPTHTHRTAVRDEFVKVKQNNGFLRKFYNFLKNKTGIGLGSNDIEKEIDKFEKGEISKEAVNNKIAQYKASQENFVQTTADVVTAATTIPGYFMAVNAYKHLTATNEVGGALFNSKTITETIIKRLPKTKNKFIMALLPILALVGGITKDTFCKIERIGSKEFAKDKTLDKEAQKADKTLKNAAKRKENWKNFGTGALNGLLAPISALTGGYVGVPAYLATTTGLRYLTSKKEDKSIKDFTETLKNNAVVNLLATTAIAIPAFKKARYSQILHINLDKVVNKLKGKQLKPLDLVATTSAYTELEKIMLTSPAIKKIIPDTERWIDPKNIDKIINDLSNENIFAVKFLQIGNYGELSKALRESCPTTRTLEQAQEHINKLWGSAEYTVSKLLGVGTVAETYLAKDKSGKEVCIKILKNGINAEKIAKDKEKFISLITGNTPADKLTEAQRYLIRNIEDLAEGISKEVDFVNEMNAAKELRKYCKVADVAIPIDAKAGIYVMEKAPGISVKTLADYYECKACGDNLRLEKIKARAPEFTDFDLSKEQIEKILKTYIDLRVEQFTKLYKNGKIIHADIHPGNIFINLEALKSGKGKLFTLIDTGNTITLSKEQAKAALKLTACLKNGNTKDLTEIILKDAILPQNLSKEQAAKQIEADLRKYFFDSETQIEQMTTGKFLTLASNITRKYNIIMSDTQLNLNKAKISAANSFDELGETLCNNIISKRQKDGKMGLAVGDIVTSELKVGAKYLTATQAQEQKNLLQMSFKEALNFLFNRNMLKTNSEEHLTYKLKQRIGNNIEEAVKKIKDN